MDMNIGVKMSGVNMDMKMDMSMTGNMEVMGDTAGLKKIRFTYSNVKMGMDIKGLPSGMLGDGMDDAMNKVGEMMEGKTIYMLLNSKNEITDVSGMQELMDAADEYNPVANEQMKKMFSKEQLNNMMGLMFQMYPDKPVQVGETWEKEADMNAGPLSMRMKNKFRLKEVNNGTAVVEVDSDYKGSGKIEQQGMSMDMDMEGAQKGEIGISTETGYLKGADYTMDAKAKAKIMGQNVPYDIKIITIMKGH